MADVPPEAPADEESAVDSSAGGQSSADERSDSSPEPGATGGEAPQVVGVDSDAAEDVLGVLSSATARAVLEALHDEPATASELADGLDASLQTVHYHLGNLAEAGVVEVTGTRAAEKGNEMDVYAPAGGPVVVFAGDEDDGDDLRAALQRLVGGFGVLALVSLLVQEVFGGGVQRLWDQPSDGPTVAETAGEVAGVEPGVAFFAGGAVVLLVGFAVWYWDRT